MPRQPRPILDIAGLHLPFRARHGEVLPRWDLDEGIADQSRMRLARFEARAFPLEWKRHCFGRMDWPRSAAARSADRSIATDAPHLSERSARRALLHDVRVAPEHHVRVRAHARHL